MYDPGHQLLVRIDIPSKFVHENHITWPTVHPKACESVLKFDLGYVQNTEVNKDQPYIVKIIPCNFNLASNDRSWRPTRRSEEVIQVIIQSRHIPWNRISKEVNSTIFAYRKLNFGLSSLYKSHDRSPILATYLPSQTSHKDISSQLLLFYLHLQHHNNSTQLKDRKSVV